MAALGDRGTDGRLAAERCVGLFGVIGLGVYRVREAEPDRSRRSPQQLLQGAHHLLS